MRHTLCVLLLVALLPLRAALGAPQAGAVFPPELVFLAGDQIGMTLEQRLKLEREAAALARITAEEGIIAQLDKLRASVDEFKQIHVGFGVAITNLPTPEQKAKLIEISKGVGKGSDGFHRLEEAAGKRIAEKIERVEETVEPLRKADRPMELEASLDRVLKQLRQEQK